MSGKIRGFEGSGRFAASRLVTKSKALLSSTPGLRRGRVLLAVFCILAIASSAPFAARAQKSANLTADLPAGEMQGKATAACTECHEARIILQQRLSKAAWTKEVDKMAKWGADVDTADRDALIDYLSSNFSADKPAYEPPRTSSAKGSSGKISK